MKILPFRRPAATDPTPWTRANHFHPRDTVALHDGIRATVIGPTPYGTLRIESPEWLLTPATAPDALRHTHDCPPCEADQVRREAEAAARETAHWAQWSPDELAAYDTAMAGMQLTEAAGLRRYRFGVFTPVRPWMRVFDGRMTLPLHESNSLTLGRACDPALDWLQLEADHASDGLSFANPYEGGPPWPAIRRAYTALRDAGLPVALVADLEMALLDDGTLGARVEPLDMTVTGAVPDAVAQQVTAILGRGPDDASGHRTAWFLAG